MGKIGVLLALTALALGQRAPLDRWLAGPDRSDLKWTVELPSPLLSNFQRIMMRVTMRVDGKEIAERSGKGEFAFIAQFRDASKQLYGTAMKVNLQEYSKATSRNELECILFAFVLPGVYDVTLGVIEAATEKISVSHRTVRVGGLNGDPLPDLWRGLPAVQFVDLPEPPDRWFLPGEPARMPIHVTSRRPVKLEVLANVSPTEISQRQRRAFDRNMEAIIPALKMLSQVEIANGSRDFTVIDLARRRVEFEQQAGGLLDWAALRKALNEDSPNKIDAASLKDRNLDAQFLSDEAMKLASGDEKRVLVVLSGPVAFASHQDVQAPTAAPNARVYYLRFQNFVFRPPVGRGPIPAAPPLPSDDLPKALRALQPRVIDIYSPLDFRKALATILKEIQQ